MAEQIKSGSLSKISWKDIIGLRQVLAHAYFRVDPEIIWETAVVKVPALVTALKSNGTDIPKELYDLYIKGPPQASGYQP